MNCFPCCATQKSKKSFSKREHGFTEPQEPVTAKTPDMKKQKADEQNQVDSANINAQNFTFRELATATKNFKQECLLSEGGFGRVYRGIIPSSGQAVAVKQLDRHGAQSIKEFLGEVSTLSLLHHENLVNLIGYCADGDQRLLVYEFVHGSTLEDHLLENKTDEPPLDWFNRMKVAAGASKGLEYLHESANPPVIYRDLKASNILLGNDLNPRLLDFGMAKLFDGDKMNNAPPRVMGTYGYCAPEYVRTGQLTLKSDVYSFGVVLLELITGRRAIDTTRPNEEQNLVSWAQPLFRDPKRYPDMADPLLQRHFPEKDLNQAVAIAAMCLQEEAEARPLISDVVTALSFLSTEPTEIIPPSLPPATSVSKERGAGESERDQSESESGSETETDKDSHTGDSSDKEKGKGSDHEDNETARNHVLASAKYQESDVPNIEDDNYKNGSQPQNVYSSKSSHKSSTRSRNGTLSSDSGDGSISSSNKSSKKSHGEVGNLSQKTSRKSSLSQKSSKKTSAEDLRKESSKKSSAEDLRKKCSKKSSEKDLSQKSSRKSSSRDLSHKSSRKSSVRVLSHKSSKGSDEGSISCGSSTASLSHYSSSVASEDGGVDESVHSDLNSSKRTEEESIHLEHAISMGSDGGIGGPFDRISSSGSDEGSVHSR